MRAKTALAARQRSNVKPRVQRFQRDDAPLSGRAVFDAESCQYADAVRPGDLIAADFDAREVHTGGALYLVEAIKGRHVVWRGCRRLTRVPDGLAVDQSGRGDWVTIASLESVGWRIAGRVEKVYRATAS